MGRDESSYLAALRTTLRSTAGAYGYTLTITTCTAVLTTVHGKPRTGELFLFIVGGLIAFAVLDALLEVVPVNRASPDHAFPFAGALNFLSVGAALGAAAGLAYAIDSSLAWLLAPMAATAVYMLLVAVQVMIVGGRRRSP